MSTNTSPELSKLFESAADLGSPQHVSNLLKLANQLGREGYDGESYQVFELAFDVSRRSNSLDKECRVLLAWSHKLLSDGNSDAAKAKLVSAKRISHQLQDAFLIARTHTSFADFYRHWGFFDEMRVHLLAAARLFDEINLPREELNLRTRLSVEVHGIDPDMHKANLARVIELASATGDIEIEVDAKIEMARTLFVEKHFSLCAKFASDAYSVCVLGGAKAKARELALTIGKCFMALQSGENAQYWFALAVRYCGQSASEAVSAEAKLWRCCAKLMRGKPGARSEVDRCLRAAHKAGLESLVNQVQLMIRD
jgi:hypothetical protein